MPKSKLPKVLYAGKVREPHGGWALPNIKAGALVVLVKGRNGEYVFVANDGYVSSLSLAAGKLTANMGEFCYDGAPLKPLWPTKVTVVEKTDTIEDALAGTLVFKADNRLRLKARSCRNTFTLIMSSMAFVVAGLAFMAWMATFGRIPHLVRRLRARI